MEHGRNWGKRDGIHDPIFVSIRIVKAARGLVDAQKNGGATKASHTVCK